MDVGFCLFCRIIGVGLGLVIIVEYGWIIEKLYLSL